MTKLGMNVLMFNVRDLQHASVVISLMID